MLCAGAVKYVCIQLKIICYIFIVNNILILILSIFPSFFFFIYLFVCKIHANSSNSILYHVQEFFQLFFQTFKRKKNSFIHMNLFFSHLISSSNISEHWKHEHKSKREMKFIKKKQTKIERLKETKRGKTFFFWTSNEIQKSNVKDNMQLQSLSSRLLAEKNRGSPFLKFILFLSHWYHNLIWSWGCNSFSVSWICVGWKNQSLSKSTTSLNLKFSFSLTICYTRVKEHSVPNYLFLAEWRIIGFIPCPLYLWTLYWILSQIYQFKIYNTIVFLIKILPIFEDTFTHAQLNHIEVHLHQCKSLMNFSV